jgi:urease accessory protein
MPQMLRATSVLRKAAVKADRVADTIALGHRERSRGGATVTAASGLSFVIDLDKPTVLNDGDALKLEDGRLVQVRAAAESLLEIRAENPLRLTRLAWHLGGHHVPAEMTSEALYVPNDAALGELVRGQGCAMTVVERPFQPEQEVHHHAHGGDCGCGHDHHHHDHHHGHDHAHHHHHAHGEGCGCGHDHHGHDHHDHGHKGHSHDH